jgi:hypothetical protein
MDGLFPVQSGNILEAVSLRAFSNDASVRLESNTAVEIGNTPGVTHISLAADSGRVTATDIAVWSRSVVDAEGNWVGVTIPPSKGGTGLETIPEDGLLVGNGTDPVGSTAGDITWSQSDRALDLSQGTRIRFPKRDASIYQQYRSIVYHLPEDEGDWKFAASTNNISGPDPSLTPLLTYDLPYGVTATSAGVGSTVLAGIYGQLPDVLDASGNLAPVNFASSTGSILARFDDKGVLTWSARSTSRGFQDMDVDSEGNVILAGQHRSQQIIFFNSDDTIGKITSLLPSNEGIYLAKYAGAGTVVWVALIDGSDTDFAKDLKATPAGKVIVCGQFLSNILKFYNSDGTHAVQYDLNRLTNDRRSTFVALYDADGYVINTARVGSNSNDVRATSVEVARDGTGHIVLAGTYAGTLDPEADSFQEPPGTPATYKGFVYRYDGDTLALITGQGYSTTIYVNVSDIFLHVLATTNAYGNLFASGTTTATSAWHTFTSPIRNRPASFSGTAGFVLDITSDATAWVSGIIYGIACDSHGDLYVCGHFTGAQCQVFDVDPIESLIAEVSRSSDVPSGAKVGFLCKIPWKTGGSPWIAKLECVGSDASVYTLDVKSFEGVETVTVGGQAASGKVVAYNADGSIEATLEHASGAQNFMVKYDLTGRAYVADSMHQSFVVGNQQVARIRASDGAFVSKNIILNSPGVIEGSDGTVRLSGNLELSGSGNVDGNTFKARWASERRRLPIHWMSVVMRVPRSVPKTWSWGRRQTRRPSHTRRTLRGHIRFRTQVATQIS